MECEHGDCGREAVAEVTWKLFERTGDPQKAAFCQGHVDDLWDRIQGAVTAGLMFYQISNAPTFRRACEEAS